MSVLVTAVRLNRSSLLLNQVLSQCLLEKIRRPFLVESNPSRCSVGSAKLPLCAESGRLPRLVRRKVAMRLGFTIVYFRNFI